MTERNLRPFFVFASAKELGIYKQASQIPGLAELAGKISVSVIVGTENTLESRAAASAKAYENYIRNENYYNAGPAIPGTVDYEPIDSYVDPVAASRNAYNRVINGGFLLRLTPASDDHSFSRQLFGDYTQAVKALGGAAGDPSGPGA